MTAATKNRASHTRARDVMTPEHPILFSAPMVRAILDGSKTQTRRVVTRNGKIVSAVASVSKPIADIHPTVMRLCPQLRCPFGEPGDQLWVRETWGLHATEPADGPDAARVYYRSTDGDARGLRYQ